MRIRPHWNQCLPGQGGPQVSHRIWHFARYYMSRTDIRCSFRISTVEIEQQEVQVVSAWSQGEILSRATRWNGGKESAISIHLVELQDLICLESFISIYRLLYTLPRYSSTQERLIESRPAANYHTHRKPRGKTFLNLIQLRNGASIITWFLGGFPKEESVADEMSFWFMSSALFFPRIKTMKWDVLSMISAQLRYTGTELHMHEPINDVSHWNWKRRGMTLRRILKQQVFIWGTCVGRLGMAVENEALMVITILQPQAILKMQTSIH